jgi:hypothetical protein
MKSTADIVNEAQRILCEHLQPSRLKDLSPNAQNTDTLKKLVELFDNPVTLAIQARETDPEAQFMDAWNNYVEKVTYPINIEKGFFAPDRIVLVGDQISLMHSEISEGYEAHRKGLKDDKLPQYDGLPVELGDCVIRIMNFCRYFKHDIASMIVQKTRFNRGRPYMHGGKSC